MAEGSGQGAADKPPKVEIIRVEPKKIIKEGGGKPSPQNPKKGERT